MPEGEGDHRGQDHRVEHQLQRWGDRALEMPIGDRLSPQDRLPQVTDDGVAEPVAVAVEERLVEAELGVDPGHRVGGGRWPEDVDGRVAGQGVHQAEHHERHHQQDRDHAHDPPQGVAPVGEEGGRRPDEDDQAERPADRRAGEPGPDHDSDQGRDGVERWLLSQRTPMGRGQRHPCGEHDGADDPAPGGGTEGCVGEHCQYHRHDGGTGSSEGAQSQSLFSH